LREISYYYGSDLIMMHGIPCGQLARSIVIEYQMLF
jgi:hypothetical protein